MSGHDRISPTAHYTGYVWCRHGLSPPGFATREGAAMFHAMRAPIALASLGTGGMTLEKMLLQRHLILDHLLERAIDRGVGTIVEVAAGLSGRGQRFVRRFPELVYVEADRERSRAIVTEGLLSYFTKPDVLAMWQRFAAFLDAGGVYLSDVHLDDATHRVAALRAFRTLLGTFARGSIHLHFADEAAIRAALSPLGLSQIRLHGPGDHPELPLPRARRDHVRVLEAWR